MKNFLKEMHPIFIGLGIGILCYIPLYIYFPSIREIEKPIEIQSSPVMDRIMNCESSGQHLSLKDGQVIVHVNKDGTYDVGVYQINSIWNQTATKLGYNLFLEVDNKAFAMWLYKNKGTGPWYSSQKCWNN